MAKKKDGEQDVLIDKLQAKIAELEGQIEKICSKPRCGKSHDQLKIRELRLKSINHEKADLEKAIKPKKRKSKKEGE